MCTICRFFHSRRSFLAAGGIAAASLLPEERGPHPDRAALQPTGIMGDRAAVISTDPREIGAFIEKRC